MRSRLEIIVLFNFIVLGGWYAFCQAPAILYGQDLSNSEVAHSPDIAQLSTQDLHSLVELLKDPRFELRERAANDILSTGAAALDVLKEIPEHWPLDARQQARSLRKEIEERVLTQRTKEFLTDLDPTRSHGLPAWEYFRGIAGDSRCSKLLFLQMIHSQYSLLDQIEKIHVQRLAGADCTHLQIDLSTRSGQLSAMLYPRIYRGTNESVGDSAAILLATAILESTAPIESNQLIYSAVQLSFFGHLSKPGYRQCLQKLLTHWVPKTHDEMAPEVMRISFDLDLPTVLPIARRHLSSTFDKHTRENAIFCIGKFGDLSDVADLMKLATDTSVVHEFNESVQGFEETSLPPPGLPGLPGIDPSRKLVRISDLAAVSAMILLNQDVKQTFPRFTREDFFSKSVGALAVSDAESEARFESIKAWMLRQLDNS